jgi:hypothetical protein
MIEPVKNSSPRIAELVDEVRSWSLDDRMRLVRRILDSVDADRSSASVEIGVAPMTLPAEKVFGILARETPPPTDEECDRLLQEERMKKSG